MSGRERDMAISARNPQALCEPRILRRLCVSLATLDRILCPDWVFRYYSFDAHWGENELMGSMRDGSGDEFFIGFAPAGAFIKGFAHEKPMSPFRSNPPALWPGMYAGIPESLAPFRDEPAFSPDEVTFCLWWDAQSPGWAVGVKGFPNGPDPDGSEELLAIFDANPRTYKAFADAYYEVNLPLGAVAAIYEHEKLTDRMIMALNAEADPASVRHDAVDVGYGQDCPFL